MNSQHASILGSLLVAVALPGALPAQMNVRTLGSCGLRIANQVGATVASGTFPSGTLVLPQLLSVVGPAGATCSSAITRPASGGSYELAFRQTGTKFAALQEYIETRNFSTGRSEQNLLVDLASPGGRLMHGTLSVTFTPAVVAFCTVTIEVDVDNDGIVDMKWIDYSSNGAEQLEIPLTVFGTRSIAIRCVVTTTNMPGVYDVALALRFTPTPGVSFSGYGAACGATLGWSTSPSIPPAVVFQVTGAIPYQPVLLLLGTGEATLPLPFSSCLQLVGGASILPLTAWANGDYQGRLVYPLAMRGAVASQAISVDPARLALRASNGVWLDFR